MAERDIKPENLPHAEAIPFLGRIGRRHHVDEDTELERLAYLKDEGRLRRRTW